LFALGLSPVSSSCTVTAYDQSSLRDHTDVSLGYLRTEKEGQSRTPLSLLSDLDLWLSSHQLHDLMSETPYSYLRLLRLTYNLTCVFLLSLLLPFLRSQLDSITHNPSGPSTTPTTTPSLTNLLPPIHFHPSLPTKPSRSQLVPNLPPSSTQQCRIPTRTTSTSIRSECPIRIHNPTILISSSRILLNEARQACRIDPVRRPRRMGTGEGREGVGEPRA
jgi:hypothetical protein